MAKGNEIVLTPEFGRKFEGVVYGTPKPGTVMQIKAATEPKSGRYTFEAYNRDLDGDHPQGPMFILDIDVYQGRVETDAYVSGDRCQVWIPWPGCELNMLVSAAGTGTGDSVAIGALLIVNDGDGLLVATTGSPETEPFVCLETTSDVVSTGTLTHVMFTGY